MPESMLVISNEVRAWSDKVVTAASAAGLGDGTARTLRIAFDRVVMAAAGLAQAQAQIGVISSEPRLYRDEKVNQANAMIGRAGDAALVALDALESQRASIADRLDAQLQVKKPTGVSDVLLVDKKHEIEGIAKYKGGEKPEALIFALNDLLSAALDSGDDLKVWILATQLDDWAQGHGVQLAQWAELRAQTIAKHRQARDGSAVVPGTDLYRVLVMGGEGTLAGYIVYARNIIQTNIYTLQEQVQRGSVYWRDGIEGTPRG